MNAEGEEVADVLIKNGVIEGVHAHLTVRTHVGRGCAAELHGRVSCVCCACVKSSVYGISGEVTHSFVQCAVSCRSTVIVVSQAPEEATIIDAEGKYVVPGGIDPHTHLSFPTITGKDTNETFLRYFRHRRACNTCLC